MKATQEQIAIVSASRSFDDMTINACAGSGKALRDDQPVLTPTGYRKISELQVNDLVFGSDGNAYPVLGVYKQGVRPLYEVTFSDWTTVVADEDHLWQVQRADHRVYNKDKFFVKTTLELLGQPRRKAGPKAESADGTRSYWFLPMTAPVNLSSDNHSFFEELPIDPWLLGVLLGDGGLSGGSVIISTADDQILESVRDIATEYGMRVVKKENSYDYRITSSKENHGVSWKSHNALINALENLGVFGLRSHEKFIPKQYIFSSVENRLAVLQGLFDTDGSVAGGSAVEYSSTSKRMAEEVQFIVHSLGGTAPMAEKHTRCKMSYRLYIKLPSQFIPFRLKRKVHSMKPSQHEPYRAIRSIVKVEPAEATCIEIASPDHLFLTASCVVTHNTSSLKMITQARPEANALLFCFNKSIQLQAQASMPTWCKSSTFHGVAYGQIGKYFAHKLKVPLSPFSICRALRMKPNEENAHLATVAKYTLRRFCQSDDNAILGFHVPHESVMAKEPADRNAFKEEVVMMARKVWLLAMNAKEKEVGIEHDFYQKLFSLEGARIPGKYDVILVDEAQDMTPVNLDILRKQYGQKILVGDSCQSLYQWKGSIDSLETWDATHRLNLTMSFRFGQVIADCANQVLGLLDAPPPPIVGAEWKQSRISYEAPHERHVVLCRSNAGLLGETVRAIDTGRSIHVIGSLMDSINLIESAWYLSIGEMAKVKHPTMKLIGTWENVLEMSAEDADMKIAVKRVEEYGAGIPMLCEKLRNAGEVSEDRADVILSTVHKFKGKQAPIVKLSDDFPDLVRWNKKERRYKPNKPEIFAFYVAVTRAEDVLIGNSNVQNLRTLKELL